MTGQGSFRVLGAAGLGVLIVALFAAAGCAPQASGPGAGVFSKEYYIGGGYEIKWTAKEKGTAFLVEETKKKILKTESLEEGSEFVMSLEGIRGDEEFETLFGVKLAEAQFSLYFIPESAEDLK